MSINGLKSSISGSSTLRCSVLSSYAALQQARRVSHASASCSSASQQHSFSQAGTTRRRCQSRAALPSNVLEGDLLEDQEDSSLQKYSVQWYPGHIARAERQLKSQLKLVDVVLEVRDARADMISQRDQQDWSNHYGQQRQPMYYASAANGKGVIRVSKAAQSLSKAINDKRKARGLQSRPVRACVIGFPNVGKSALINRLLGKRLVDSAPVVGVTRSLRWIRVGGDLDLLDAPGVLPMNFGDQIAAERLAICNDIGEAAYVKSSVAAVLIERIFALPSQDLILQKLQKRLGVACDLSKTGEDYVAELAVQAFQGDKEQASQRVLTLYRQGFLGNVALELPADAHRQFHKSPW